MKKMLMSITGFIILTIFSCQKKEVPNPQNSLSGILPSSSIGDWNNAGVQGGIPDYPVGVNVHDYGAVGNGTTDDTEAILDAIAACPEGNAVFFPAGSYLITNTLTIDKSISIRGDDPTTTHVISRHNLAAINVNSDWAGLEDIHIQTDWPHFSGYQGEKIVFDGVENSWVRNIETSGYVGYHIYITGTNHCEIRDSYIHNCAADTNIIHDPTMDYAYFSSYGVHILGGGASYNLVENNILDWFRHSMVIQEFDGSAPKNNVFGYNYCGVTFTADGTHFSATTTMEFHNNSVFYNLVEGNVVEQVGFQSDGHHYNTIFRNRINNGGVSLGYSNYCIGNEFTEIKNPGSSMSIYGNSPRGYFGDYIIHGNYVTDPPDRLSWDPSIPEHNLPNSCYLSSKPEWFGDLEWPPFGGDLMPGNTRQIPAEVRYWTEIYPNLKKY